MPTATREAIIRDSILQQGVTNGIGEIVKFYRSPTGTWGHVSYREGKVPVRFYFELEQFPPDDRKNVAPNINVVFSAKPGQSPPPGNKPVIYRIELL